MIKGLSLSRLDLERELCKRNFSYFLKRSFEIIDPSVDYMHNWHIDCMSEYLKACKDRRIKRLIINVPPRSLKSICVSVVWTAWLLGLKSSEKIVTASYSKQLSVKHSLDTRYLIQSQWYQSIFPNVILAHDENQKSRFQTTDRGHRLATSVAGGVIGEGGDVLIVDDPHNPKQASSDLQRQTACDWFDQSFSTRLNNKKNGVIVIVMQRLHETDLTGTLLARGGYESLILPSIAEKKTVIQLNGFKKIREVDEILHPEREGTKELNEMKKTLGSTMFAGQYQQKPSPSGGNMFKDEWWQYYDILPPDIECSIVVGDTAQKTGQEHDYSVFGLFTKSKKGKIYLVDIMRGKWEAPELQKSFVAFWNKHKQNSNLRLNKAWIEDKVSGTGLIQTIKRDYAIPVGGIKRNTKDKIMRVNDIIPQVEAGYVFLPRNGGFVADLLHETALFPNAKNDDIVDVLADGIDLLTNHKKEIRIRNVQF